MLAASLHLLGLKGAHHPHAFLAQRQQLLLKLRWWPIAILPFLGDRRRVPGLEVGLVCAEHDPDSSGESSLFSLQDVADTFVHAPLPRLGAPRRGLRRS